jgi:DNA-binding MarR family transcriptional regulator
MDGTDTPPVKPGWTFLTNHAHVLVCISMDPEIRGRDIATRVGITERAAQAIVADLVAGGYVERTRIGRRNHYRIVMDRKLRHPLEHSHRIDELLALATPQSESDSDR